MPQQGELYEHGVRAFVTAYASVRMACREEARKLAANIEANACTARHAYFDDGTPLGSHENEERQIDSLPELGRAVRGGRAGPRAVTAIATPPTRSAWCAATAPCRPNSRSRRTVADTKAKSACPSSPSAAGHFHRTQQHTDGTLCGGTVRAISTNGLVGKQRFLKTCQVGSAYRCNDPPSRATPICKQFPTC